MELNISTEGVPSIKNVTKAEASAFVDDILALLIYNQNQGGIKCKKQ